MKTVKVVKLVIIIPLLVIDLYLIAITIIGMRDPDNLLWVSLMFLFPMVLVAGMLIWALVPIFKDDSLQKTGEQASATVLQVWDTGVTVDEHNIQVGLLLDVHYPDHSPHQVKTKALVPRIQPALYQPGMVVQVRYDSKKPDKVIIESVGNPSDNNVSTNIKRVVSSETIIYQGKTYNNADDLPPEARSKYKKAMSTLADRDGDGIPDILQGSASNADITQADHSTGTTASDSAEKLRKLKEMLDDGLITYQEYTAKKADILERM